MQKWSLNYNEIANMGPRQKTRKKVINVTQMWKKATESAFPLVSSLSATSPRALSSFHYLICLCVDSGTKFAI